MLGPRPPDESFPKWHRQQESPKACRGRLQGGPCHSGVGNRLRNENSPKRQSSDDVGAKPFGLIAREPSENGKNSGKRFELR